MSLPILSNSFFEKHRPQLSVFQKWQSASQWSAHFMPIYEWDDVLFVGCSQMPAKAVQANCKVVFVLCTTEVLNNLWEEFQSPTVIMQQSAPSSNDMPEGLSAMNLPSAAPQTVSFDDLGISADEAPLNEFPQEEVPAEESLEGLDLGNIPAPSLSFSNDVSAEPTVVLVPTNSAVAETLPPAPSLEKTAIVHTQEPIPAKAPVDSDKTRDTQTKAHAPTLASMSSSNATADQVFQDIFKEMEKNFEKSMLLIKKGDQVIPWKWSSQFQSSNPQGTKTVIPLLTPSPFRIVFRSQKSYHGYIVPNDQTNKFFAEWNGSQIPDHLTLSPILIDDNIVGMILGIGSKTADTKTTLLQTEHLAESLSKKFKTTPAIMNAA